MMEAACSSDLTRETSMTKLFKATSENSENFELKDSRLLRSTIRKWQRLTQDDSNPQNVSCISGAANRILRSRDRQWIVVAAVSEVE